MTAPDTRAAGLTADDLDRLEGMAKAAIAPGYPDSWFKMSAFRKIANAADAEFMLELSPQTALRLIAAARTALEVRS
jgi:hypothetical protein